MTKFYTHAGVSRKAGKLKFRASNRVEYIDILIKEGHNDLDIIQLKHVMSKDDAVSYLLSIDFDNGNAEVRGVLEAEATKRKLPGYTKAELKARDAAAEALIAELVEQADEAEAEDNRIEMPERELSMTPNAIRKREARAAAAARMVEELAEAGVEFAEDKDAEVAVA